MARENHPFGIILLFFCASACPLSPHNSRSQEIAPHHQENLEGTDIQ